MTQNDFISYIDEMFAIWRIKEKDNTLKVYVGEPIDVGYGYDFNLIDERRPAGLIITFQTMNWLQKTFWKNKQWIGIK